MPGVSTRSSILRRLADGGFHSGPELGEALGITRAAVHKGIHGLRASGLAIHCVPGRGYRLDAPLDLLSKDKILTQLGGAAEAMAERLHIAPEIDSTSTYLLGLAPDRRHGAVCVAEVQSRGRGRRGREWVATPFRNIMLSMAWRLEAGPAAITGISLAAGVAVIRALQQAGIQGAGLKWPNDVVWNGRKLAGLLLDVQGEAAGPSQVVLGLGLNVKMDEAEAGRIEQPWVDMEEILGRSIDRNKLVATLFLELQAMFEGFAREGLAGCREDWLELHQYANRPVRVIQNDSVVEGKVEGIDDRGALVVRDASGQTHVFHSGDISLRAGE
jgi:BirA family biotin operon repressor/biotin-[acetyl-CoA-carboxylase] ligase